MFLERQARSLCAVHALNNLIQKEIPDFSEADLREGARLARAADWEAQLPFQAGGEQERHEDDYGNFTYQAVGSALGHRRCDWKAVVPRYDQQGTLDPEATIAIAFLDVSHHG